MLLLTAFAEVLFGRHTTDMIIECEFGVEDRRIRFSEGARCGSMNGNV